MLLIGLTAVKALAASPEKVEVAAQETAKEAAEMSLFDFLGVMVADDDGWVDPLDFEGPAGRELDPGERNVSLEAPAADTRAADEAPLVEERP